MAAGIQGPDIKHHWQLAHQQAACGETPKQQHVVVAKLCYKYFFFFEGLCLCCWAFAVATSAACTLHASPWWPHHNITLRAQSYLSWSQRISRQRRVSPFSVLSCLVSTSLVFKLKLRIRNRNPTFTCALTGKLTPRIKTQMDSLPGPKKLPWW